MFFNPLSEKIKLINSTKYWGDKIKIKDATGKIYPVWRTDMNYKFGGITHKIDSDLKEKGEQLQTLYLPQHASLLPPNWVKKNWDNIESIDLNGFENKSTGAYTGGFENTLTDEIKSPFDFIQLKNQILPLSSTEVKPIRFPFSSSIACFRAFNPS